MSLHLVYSPGGWQACRQRLQSGDAVVLLGDGVYAVHEQQVVVSQALHVLAEDAEVRGIQAADGIHTVSYDALVALCVEHHPVISWND